MPSPQPHNPFFFFVRCKSNSHANICLQAVQKNSEFWYLVKTNLSGRYSTSFISQSRSWVSFCPRFGLCFYFDYFIFLLNSVEGFKTISINFTGITMLMA